jgi:hypothetical protein
MLENGIVGDARKAEEVSRPPNAVLRLTISEFAVLLGLQEDTIRERIAHACNRQEYYSIGELAGRVAVFAGDGLQPP